MKATPSYSMKTLYSPNLGMAYPISVCQIEPAHDQEAVLYTAYSADHELDALYARAKFEGSDEWTLIFYDESFQGGEHGEVTASFEMPDGVVEIQAFGHCKHYGAWAGDHLRFNNNGDHDEL